MTKTETCWPADPKKIGDEFGVWTETRKKLGLGSHRGLDFAVKAGTHLKSVGNGRVLQSVWSDELGWQLEIKVRVKVNGKNGTRVFSYCHLAHKPDIKPGTKVSVGEVICISGNSGRASTGDHLHLMAGRSKGLAHAAVEDPRPLIEATLIEA